MTRIEFFVSNGTVVGFEATGHSGAAKRGEDVVCAAVSVLLQALELGMLEVLKVSCFEHLVDREVPLRRMIWGGISGDGARVLVSTIKLSLESLAASHSRYIAVSEVEVDELRF